MDITLFDFIDYMGRWVLLNSVLSILLPPVEFFDDYPRFQKLYRTVCKFIKYFGNLDLRGKIIAQYPQYQKRIENGESKGQ